jgi:DNA-binding SARP family transcriptional activator
MTSPLYRFYLFGSPRLCIEETPIALPPQPAALCAFLILNRQRRITREEVQAAFWPDALPTKAQERLRRTLYLFRQALHPHADLLAAEGTELTIAPDVSLWVDYEAFEKELIDAYREDPPLRIPLERAVELYTDDLLKDIYVDWALLEREHARQRFLTGLRQLMLACQQDGDWQCLIQYAHRLLEQDPLQEIAHRALMTAYAAAGDRSAAVRQYQQCVQILENELSAEPLPETTRLYDDIRQGRGVVPVEMPLPVMAAAPVAPDLQAVPLVGRDQELAEIAAEWRICQEKNSRLVLVTGPAGMGKTRVVEEAAKRIPGPGVTILTGNCYAMEAGTPYQLISDLMQKAVGRVANRLSTLTRADLASLVPAFQSELRGGTLSRLVNTPDTSVRLQEAVTQVIRLLASSGEGLWLITEDLHWADPASLACLNHALRRCSDLPLMVLATLRSEEVSFDSPLMDWPVSSVHAPAPTTLIELPPLLPDQLQHLLASLVKQDAARLTPLLHRETAGNPFFVVETLRGLIEQGILYQEPGGRWQLRSEALPQAADLPISDAMLRMIRGRIRRLSRSAQEVLTTAAVIEHDIDEKILNILVDPSLAVDLALDEILRSFIFEETAPGLYQFSHIKVREIIYADTSAPRRRFLHRRIAELLSQQRDGLGRISRLAYHYDQAREWTQALIYGWQAAQTALAAGALAEANRYANSAQHILDEHLSELDLSLLPESIAAIRFDLLTLRAEFRRQTATAGLYYPPDLLQAIDTLLPDVDESRRAQASLQQAFHRLGQGDLQGAKESAKQGRTLYAQLGDSRGELDAIQHQIDIAYRAGDMVTMRHLLDDIRHLGDEQRLAQNEMQLAVYDGDWNTVLRLASALSQSQHDPAVAWLSLANLGLAYMKLGAYEQASTLAQEAVEASEEADVLGLGARVLLARLELEYGRPEQAKTMLLRLFDRPDPLMGEVEIVAPALALVRCCVALGDQAGAKEWAKRASEAANRIQLPILYPLNQVAWTLSYLVAGKYDPARKGLLYPLEYLFLLPDTSPQEILVLRAVAARGLDDIQTAQNWLIQARDLLRQQADMIEDDLLRDSFLNRVPLHRFIAQSLENPDWKPEAVLRLHL